MLVDFEKILMNSITNFTLILLLFLLSSVRSEPSDGDAKAYTNVEICSGFSQGSCPVNCFRPDPVCGEDGVTYWCGCPDAACAGARVAYSGYCEIGNGGSVTLSGQALLLVHIVWLIMLGFSVLLGLF